VICRLYAFNQYDAGYWQRKHLWNVNYRAHTLQQDSSFCMWFICNELKYTYINNELLISSYITIVIIGMYRQLFITMHLWNADIHTSLAVNFLSMQLCSL